MPNIKEQEAVKPQDASNNLQIDIEYGKIPLYFIPNKGQVNEIALFYATTSKYTLWLTKEGLVFESKTIKGKKEPESRRMDPKIRISPRDYEHERDVSRIKFLNANEAFEVIPLDETEHRVNYFIGNDESKWRSDIRTSKAVLYREVYPDIDLRVYGIEKEIEYDWKVGPGGDVGAIRFEYDRVKETKIDKEGNLVVKTGFGEVAHRRPESYQLIDGERIDVDVRFKKLEKDVYGFDTGYYREDHELVIDPVILVYSTYLGGDSNDWGNSIAFDASGCAYMVGHTYSTDFPTYHAFISAPGRGAGDAIVTKLSPSGNSLVYSTYLGGDNLDEGQAIAVDNAGNAYITGYTYSTNFPIMNAYMTDPGDNEEDVFVTKLSSTGSNLLYSTYLGGNKFDEGRGIAVDNTGHAYLTGSTESTDFPTVNAYMTDPLDNVSDVFVTKLSSAGSTLLYSTYLGGSSFDEGSEIAVDSTGNAYVTGSTSSTDFPSKNAYMKDPDGSVGDAFVTKLAPSVGGINSLVYSTHLGGAALDSGTGVAVDSSGNAYIVGFTDSTDFPTLNPFMTDPLGGSRDAFVTKMSTGGDALIYSTYLGGESSENGLGIATDKAGCAYVIGYTNSTDFPTGGPYGAYQNDQPFTDAFVTKLAAAGDALVYSTYLGGDGYEYGVSIAVDNIGCAYITGDTSSTDFPTVNAYMTDGATTDAFVTKLVDIPLCFIFGDHDFNGDGDSDASVFRPSNGRWYIKDVGSYAWGASGDIPVNGDYNGDGTTDVAVWRPLGGRWYIRGVGSFPWGISGDLPVPGNYDGDINGATDIAVWRPSSGRWYINGVVGSVWGAAGDIPVPGDYNGDGITDIAVWRPSNGRWYIKGIGGSVWGTAGDCPVPGDYNGDGTTDIAVWRPSNGRWYIKGVAGSVWGTAGDIPAPGDYNGDGTTEIAVWRPSNGRWYLKGLGGYLWGMLGDIPLVR